MPNTHTRATHQNGGSERVIAKGRRTKTSWIWDYFRPNLKGAKCIRCEKPYGEGTSTGTLMAHLLKKHGITQPENPIEKYAADSEEQKARDQALLRAVIANNYSFRSFFDSKSMRRLFALLDPRYAAPCAQTARSRVELYANELRKRLSTELLQAQSISLTTDLWTKHGKSFMGITAQAITQDDKIENYTLGMFEFTGRHTADELLSNFKKVVTGFISLDRITSLTTDNASNMRKFAEKLDLQYISCFAHLIQLIVRAGILQIKELVKRCSVLAVYLRRCHAAKTTLIAVQTATDPANDTEVKSSRTIPLCNDTRWNSTYLMLSTLLKERDNILEVQRQLQHQKCGITRSDLSATDAEQEYEELNQFGSDGEIPEAFIQEPLPKKLTNKNAFLSMDDWVELEEVVAFLAFFAKLTMAFQSETVYLSDALITILSIDVRLNTEQANETCTITRMRRAMAEKSKTMNVPFARFLKSDGPHMICTALDPRWAATARRQLPDFTQTVAKIKDLIESKTVAPRTKSRGASGPTTDACRKALFSVADEYLEPRQGPVRWDEYEEFMKISEKMEKEQRETLLPVTWWIHNKYLFPSLAPLALQYFTMQPTEVPSERLFSAAGRIFTKARARFLSKSLEDLIFIHDNDPQLKSDRRDQ
jgi:hypothetical protein